MRERERGGRETERDRERQRERGRGRESGERGWGEREKKQERKTFEFHFVHCPTTINKQPSGYALAGHSATLTPDQRLVVIGGVNRDQRISPRTLLYHLVTDSWEVLPVRTLDLPGKLHCVTQLTAHALAYKICTCTMYMKEKEKIHMHMHLHVAWHM